MRILRAFLRESTAACVIAALVAGACGGPSSNGSDDGPVRASGGSSPSARDSLRSEVDGLRLRSKELRNRLDELQPRGAYIVVNTTINMLQLRENGDVLLDAVCSTGSDSELISPGGRRRWVFSTPKGVFKVLRKMVAPVWLKPDWAFIEEGVPVPPAGSPERREEGVLGMYGLCFGDGYLIHGTLFDRFLGQSVTHGCIRLGDDDLELVYKASGVGTPIYIY